MNIQKLTTTAVKSAQSTDKVASSSGSLRVRSDLKAGGLTYSTPGYHK